MRRYGYRKRSYTAGFIATAAICMLVLFVMCESNSRNLNGGGRTFARPAVSHARTEEDHMIEMGFIDQREKWPTGCESVSAVMVLNHMGINIDPDKFIDDYLPKGTPPDDDGSGERVGCDPTYAFPGDPRTPDGWGIFQPGLEQAIKNVLTDYDITGLRTVDLTGSSLEELCSEYISRDIPVIFWGTIDMAPPRLSVVFQIEGTDDTFQWISPMHCLVLTGFDDDGYYFNDPLAGANVFYPKEAVELAYETFGKQAMTIMR